MDRGRVERGLVDSVGTKIGDAIADGVEVSGAVVSGVGAFEAVAFEAVTFAVGTFVVGVFGVGTFEAVAFGRGGRGVIALRAAPSGASAFAPAVFEAGGFAAAVFEAGGFAAGMRGLVVPGVVVPGVVVPAVAEPPEVVREAAGRPTRGDVAAASAGCFTDASGASPEVGAADAPAGFSSASESIAQPYQRPLVCLSENWASHHKLGT